ncbi:uncharacterized protein LOC101890712 [Musca domestica]|uniref:Uncharacterized protein LOC101890712 n=1 Tax=Musca domestica TaxID=7370 RepID=A0A1I8N1L1_MUSDO|nr:uncharacterized protein LOC101890712 [Musca domestica]
MAQDYNIDSYIDVDNTVVQPSPQRVRNILTLEEKVAAIKAYNQRPMYTRVARMFNCSWEQIKNIITNRDAIMEFYEATTKQEEMPMDLKQRKAQFLNECVYELIQRIQYHMKLPVTEELIRLKALEFQDYIKLEDFTPHKKWLNGFKCTYNISLANKHIVLNRIPPASMDLKDVMAYCTKNSCSHVPLYIKDLKQKYSSLDEKTPEYEHRRVRKLHFLQKALNEYLHRAKFHYKSMKLDDKALQKVAQEFNDILKVHDFHPTLSWIRKFRHRHDNSQEKGPINGKIPLLSLDLKDIISYCSRMNNNSKTCSITLTPKEPPNAMAMQMRLLPKYAGNTADSKIKLQRGSIIYLDEEEEEKDVKPPINEIRMEQVKEPDPSPPLKIRKIESINNDPVLQQELQQEKRAETQCNTIIKLERQETGDEEEEGGGTSNIPKASSSVTTHRTVITSTESVLQQHTNNSAIQLLSPASKSQPPTHVEEDSELPRQINNFKDVLRLLRPLEEYAMLKENYRAIGLITQLEEVLKNSDDNPTEEDFNT